MGDPNKIEDEEGSSTEENLALFDDTEFDPKINSNIFGLHADEDASNQLNDEEIKYPIINNHTFQGLPFQIVLKPIKEPELAFEFADKFIAPLINDIAFALSSVENNYERSKQIIENFKQQIDTLRQKAVKITEDANGHKARIRGAYLTCQFAISIAITYEDDEGLKLAGFCTRGISLQLQKNNNIGQVLSPLSLGKAHNLKPAPEYTVFNEKVELGQGFFVQVKDIEYSDEFSVTIPNLEERGNYQGQLYQRQKSLLESKIETIPILNNIIQNINHYVYGFATKIQYQSIIINAIENPSEENKNKLFNLAKECNGHASPLCKALAIGLMVLGVVLLLASALSFLITIPALSSGIFAPLAAIAVPLGIGLGVAGLVALGTGIGLFATKGRHHGLAKDVQTLAEKIPVSKSYVL